MGYGKVPAAESEGKAAIHGKCGTSGLYGTERGEAMLQGPLATALEAMLKGCEIFTLDALAAAIRSDGDRIADYMTSNECRQAGYAAWQAAAQRQRTPATSDVKMQADVQTAHESSQTVLTGEVIDVITVEEVLCEATDMLLAEDQRAHTAELRAARLEHEAELAAARLQRCEAARLEVEVDLARERAARRVAYQIFAVEVAAAESVAAAADHFGRMADQCLRREEWLRDCAEADKQRAEGATER